MPHARARRQWLGLFVLATLVAALGLWLCWPKLSANPVERGLFAYSKGDWEAASSLARQRLKSAGDDPAALRLLARSSMRLGRSPLALAIFNRLGAHAMLPEDLYLLGIGLSRNGNSKGALEVWEQARAADPNRTETLLALTRAYVAADQLIAAAETGRLLATRPGEEAHAEVLLGAIQLELNDPAGAVAFWQRALEHESNGQGSSSGPTISRKDIARALLQAGRPDEARHVLQSVLAARPDAEGFWLSSRVYLQERAINEALTAWGQAGSFRDENPLLPEPARFVGSGACAECHRAIYHDQQNSRHARTFFRASELAFLDLPAPSFPDPAQPKVTHTLERLEGDRLEQETHATGRVLRAVVQYAFGSGDRGLTLVGRDDHGQSRELRLSHYHHDAESFWDVTSGHPIHPSEPSEYLGQPLTDDAVRRCLLCHVTAPRFVHDTYGPLPSDHGIGCERCHGPGENHLLAVAAKFPDLSIARPTMASGARIVALCAQCHSPRGRSTTPDDPFSVRFQGTTLTWSRCFTESNDALDCTTCHDPHRNVVTSMAHYESKCLSCHPGPGSKRAAPSQARRADVAEKAARTVCPVNRTEGCIGCHMPAVKNVVPHSTFTDHFIRVHRNRPTTNSASMIEQERRAVDQGPGDILSRREPPGGGLLDAHLQIVPQADQDPIGLDRSLRELELAAQLFELGIDR
jgi:tetratricopeptide (TPR) repeat protein